MTDETTDIVPQGPDQPPPGKKIKVDCDDGESIECWISADGNEIDIELFNEDGDFNGRFGMGRTESLILGCWLMSSEEERRWHANDAQEVKLADLKGIAPGITGGLSSEEYVRRQRQGECVWTPVGDPGFYETGCEHDCDLGENQSPEKNYFAFCPFCGGELKVLKPTTDGEPT